MRRAWLGLYLRPHIISSWLSFKKLQNVEFCGICDFLFSFFSPHRSCFADCKYTMWLLSLLCFQLDFCQSSVNVDVEDQLPATLSCVRRNLQTFFPYRKNPNKQPLSGSSSHFFILLFKHINFSYSTRALSRCCRDKAKRDSIQWESLGCLSSSSAFPSIISVLFQCCSATTVEPLIFVPSVNNINK